MPLQATIPNQQLALSLLSLTYSLPIIRNRADVRRIGNDILAATQPNFDKWGVFVGTLGRTIASMQTVPAHFNTLRLKPDELAITYKRLATINWIIEATGLVGGAGAASAGAAEMIKTNSVREGASRAGARLVGRGAISDALVEKYGPRAGRGVTGLALLALASRSWCTKAEKNKWRKYAR